MTPHSIIIDDFLDNGQSFRDYAIKQSYQGVTSPWDNVMYPDISIKVPEDIQTEIISKVSKYMNLQVNPNAILMRMSKEGVKAPHSAHTDKIMGHYTFLLYLNKEEDCQGGTDILKHISGMEVHPESTEDIAIWKEDTNTSEQWVKTGYCPMKFNRGFILKSDLFHRSQPIGGFGSVPENSRLVLVMFFDVKEKVND